MISAIFGNVTGEEDGRKGRIFMAAPGLRIANHLSDIFTREISAALPDAAILPLPSGPITTVPAGAQLLLAGQQTIGGQGSRAPAGWPFDLQWVHLVSTGIDSCPDWLFDGVTVTNSPGVSAVSLAEYALAAIFAAAKRLPELWINAPDQWKISFVDSVAGATLGIVGFGAIGSSLASRAHALGMHVHAVRKSPQGLPPEVRRASDVAELLATCDHVVLAAPATAATFRMIDRAALAAAKPGLHLVNIARGSLIDDASLLEALDDGRVGRATLDATDPEPLPHGHPFYSHPRVYLSPHSSAADVKALSRIVTIFVENAARFMDGRPLLNIVDREKGY